MQALEDKLSTLSNGTEGMLLAISVCTPLTANEWTAVAIVLSNWHNVLRAINMAASTLTNPPFGVKLTYMGQSN